MSNLIDFVKTCLFGVLELSGPSKSDLWLETDSFWWGACLRTSKIELFHILGPFQKGSYRF